MDPQSRILILEDDTVRQQLARNAFAAYWPAAVVTFITTVDEAADAVTRGDADVLFFGSRHRSPNLLQALAKATTRVGSVLILDRPDDAEQLQAIRDGIDECVLEGDTAVASYPPAAARALARMHALRSTVDGSRTLLRSQKQWMSILDAITDYIFVIDEEHRVTKLNTAFARLVGKEPREVVGSPCSELFCGDLLSEFPVAGPVPESAAGIFEKVIAGETYQISIFPLCEDDRTYTIHVLKNITELKRLKDLLYHADRLASLGQLVSGVAHEINNPLTGTIAYSELLLLRPLEDDVRLEIAKILNSAQRCKRIVDNLLTFSRQRPPAKSLESFNALLDRVVELRSYALRSNSITVVKEYEDVGTVFVDAQQIQQSVLNILLNAEQALNGVTSGRCITLTTRLDRERRVVTAKIEDNGPGIPAHLLSRIFDPFFTTKPVGLGTGLGLSIAHGVVTEHGGTLHAENSEKGGARFVLELPTGAGRPGPGIHKS